MRHIPALLLAALASTAQAAPFLYSDPYPATAAQPDSASFTINGGSPIVCDLVTIDAGLQPKCDLAPITAPGIYTLVLTVARSASSPQCTGAAGSNAGDCTLGGPASSTPFLLTLHASSVATPVVHVGP